MSAHPKPDKDLPWHLKGNWAPVPDELDLMALQVKGEIPRELNGTYVRAGMNPKSGWSQHWFFGTGMLHGVTLEDGKASYRNRFVRTPYYDSDLNMMSGMRDLAASPANTNIVRHAGKWLALEETHLPWIVNSRLDTVGAYDFGGKLKGPMTAHPRICPLTGEMLFFGYQLGAAPFLIYYRVSASGEMVESEAIDIPNPVMMHDWNITRNHVVFMDLPLVFDLKAAMQGQAPFGFKPDAGARLGVMKRNGAGGKVRWFEINPCFVFHPMNAHEDGDLIVLHVCRQNKAMVGGLDDIYGGEDTIGKLWRWTIDTARGTVKEEQLDDVATDFPRVNDSLTGLPARFGYSTSLDTSAPSLTLDRFLYKYDLQTGGRETRDFGPDVHVGEPIFVPRSGNSMGEDEGWILALCHDEARDQSRLAILDAQQFEVAPVAEIILPRRIPYGAHGNWMSL